MAAGFDLQQLVHYALRREVMAWRTYERLAARAAPGEAQAMLHQLVTFEEDHVRQYTVVLRPQIQASGLDPDAIVAAAEAEPLDLEGVVDEERIATAPLSGVIQAAKGFERMMARFYEAEAAKVEDPTIRGVLEQLAGEERSHEVFLDDLQTALALDPVDDAEEFPPL
jgi:rubrerythrin